MNQVKKAVIVILIFAISAALFAQDDQMPAERQNLLIVDIVSESLTVAETKLLTEVLRTEIFKLNLFDISASPVGIEIEESVDEASIRLAKESLADLVLVCSVDTVFDSVVLNLRIVNVENNLIDFTDNVFIDDRSNLFPAVTELITKISVFYIVAEVLGDELSESAIAERWRLVGADDQDLNALLKIENGLSEFFALRQYDINFNVLDYLQIKKANWEIDTIRGFLQSGIAYRTVEEAFQLGIVSLDNYKRSFEPEGISFENYLEAYKVEIMTGEEYLRYREGFERVRLGLGAGFVADKIPVTTSDFSAPIVHVSIEYFISEYQRATAKYGIETGFSLFYGIVPAYYLQVNGYAGRFPLMGKLAIGGMAEVFVGGTVAAYARYGVELFEHFEFIVTSVFFGTPNKRRYGIDVWGDVPTPEEEIKYPFFVAEFVYKLGILRRGVK